VGGGYGSAGSVDMDPGSPAAATLIPTNVSAVKEEEVATNWGDICWLNITSLYSRSICALKRE